MMRKMFRGRGGLSNVISTVILSSVLLTIILVASYISKDILYMQVSASEFENAENLMISVDSAVNSLIFKPGSATVIKASFSNTAPGWITMGNVINITIGYMEPKIVNEGVFKIDGRQTIGGAFDYDLRGGPYLIVSPYNGSIGRIHVSRPRNLRVSLDYSRVLRTFTGMVKLYNGTDYSLHNTLEITAIEMSFGVFEVTSNSVIVIQNKGVNTETVKLEGDFIVTVKAGGETDSFTLSSIGGDPAYPTIVNYHKILMLISVFEGW